MIFQLIVYTGDEKKQFVVDVDRAMLTSNSELDINIYDSDWRKTLSTVWVLMGERVHIHQLISFRITGNQEGTRSRAFGSYLNVQMSGYTSAKLHWQLSSSIGSVFGEYFQISEYFQSWIFQVSIQLLSLLH